MLYFHERPPPVTPFLHPPTYPPHFPATRCGEPLKSQRFAARPHPPPAPSSRGP
ncbi:hypothetical protein K440DRAFT_618776 [Wilcoxina mikolae CBS 423.85]|nr:hypothetical protein K440DRAFT_618776 [Wilcoxina mikolae CBS 423.85]